MNKLLKKKTMSNNINEGLEYKDLETLVKPTLHIDEFASKMGDDADVVVLSFYIRDKQAAVDLVSFFEKGYEYILDAETSEGEVKPNRYLVYVELKRRTTIPEQIIELLTDLESLTDIKVGQWILHHNFKDYKMSAEVIAKVVPLSPHAYREYAERNLNEMRNIAGIAVKSQVVTDPVLVALQRTANIK
jgi:hypothetical protein